MGHSAFHTVLPILDNQLLHEYQQVREVVLWKIQDRHKRLHADHHARILSILCIHQPDSTWLPAVFQVAFQLKDFHRSTLHAHRRCCRRPRADRL